MFPLWAHFWDQYLLLLQHEKLEKLVTYTCEQMWSMCGVWMLQTFCNYIFTFQLPVRTGTSLVKEVSQAQSQFTKISTWSLGSLLALMSTKDIFLYQFFLAIRRSLFMSRRDISVTSFLGTFSSHSSSLPNVITTRDAGGEGTSLFVGVPTSISSSLTKAMTMGDAAMIKPLVKFLKLLAMLSDSPGLDSAALLLFMSSVIGGGSVTLAPAFEAPLPLT